MTDRDDQLIQEMEYADYLPAFRMFNDAFIELDKLQIRAVVGDRFVDQFEDKFIKLVLETFRVLEK